MNSKKINTLTNYIFKNIIQKKMKNKIINCNFTLGITDVAGIQQTHMNEDAASLTNIPEALH